MNIKKNSWHYKLLKRLSVKYRYNDPKSLCLYVNALIKELIIYGSIYLIFLYALTSVGIAGIILSYMPKGIPFELIAMPKVIEFGIIIFIVILIFLIGIIVLSTYIAIDKYIRNIIYFNNIIIEYIKSIKSKVCPLLTYIDED